MNNKSFLNCHVVLWVSSSNVAVYIPCIFSVRILILLFELGLRSLAFLRSHILTHTCGGNVFLKMAQLKDRKKISFFEQINLLVFGLDLIYY